MPKKHSKKPREDHNGGLHYPLRRDVILGLMAAKAGLLHDGMNLNKKEFVSRFDPDLYDIVIRALGPNGRPVEWTSVVKFCKMLNTTPATIAVLPLSDEVPTDATQRMVDIFKRELLELRSVRFLTPDGCCPADLTQQMWLYGPDDFEELWRTSRDERRAWRVLIREDLVCEEPMVDMFGRTKRLGRIIASPTLRPIYIKEQLQSRLDLGCRMVRAYRDAHENGTLPTGRLEMTRKTMRQELDKYKEAKNKSYVHALNADREFRQSIYYLDTDQEAFVAGHKKVCRIFEQAMFRRALAAEENKEECDNHKWFFEGPYLYNLRHLERVCREMQKKEPNYRNITRWARENVQASADLFKVSLD